MESNRAEIQELRSQLDALIQKYVTLNSDVNELRLEMRELRTRIDNLAEADASVKATPKSEKVETPKAPEVEVKVPEVAAEKAVPIIRAVPEPVVPEVERPNVFTPPSEPKEKSNIEAFLGENLANKIGIAIILIGIGVGVKYAIDKNILGPAMRIALGYLAGAILIGFAIYLKKKYENLSAVMFAGGMAVAYFVTFIAFDFYHLFPKMAAFGIMLGLTVITSLAAIRYNKQVIAIVGLVGAYSVPFLLSDGTGLTSSLFIYMTIINAGILFLAFRKNWQPVFVVAFGCTWLIFIVVGARAFISHPSDYKTLLLFGSIFYALFYAMLIANKMKHKEHVGGPTMPIVIMNSILGYAAGMALVTAIYDDSVSNGIYTLLFAASQGVVTLITMKQKEADHHLYYLSFGFALSLVTASIPMLFDGKWITILWSLQAAVFFWIGWKKDDGLFEKICYFPILLAFGSLFHSWMHINLGIDAQHISPFLNEYFLAGIVLTGALFFMTYLKYQSEKPSDLSATNETYSLLSNSLIYLGIIALYLSIFKEIDIYWDQKISASHSKSGFTGDYFSSPEKLKVTWMIIFSLVYTGAIQLFNRFSLKDVNFSKVFGIASLLAIVAFLISGLYDMASIRHHVTLENDEVQAAEYGLSFAIRALSYLALGFGLVSNWFSLRHFSKPSSSEPSDASFVIFANSFIYVGIVAIYLSIFKETDMYWEQREALLELEAGYLGEFITNTSKLKTIWMIIFSLMFTGVIQLINRYSLKDKMLSTVMGAASTFAVVSFLFIGLYNMSVIRDRTLDGVNGIKMVEYGLTFTIRYIGFAALGFVLWANWYSLRYFFKEHAFKHAIEIFLHLCLVWVACSELINLQKLNGGGDLYRAGLSIFCGMYSFGLIAFGIWKKKSHLRLLALVLFGVTLLKLFIYDIAKVDSGGKTIAFISLGVLLLVISFLYTKYKHYILPGGDEVVENKANEDQQ